MLTSPEAAVLEANRSFYVAFLERDIEAMQKVWAIDHPVSCIHPGWTPLVGREPVMASFRAILASPDTPRIDMSDAHPAVRGDIAWVICIENLGHATVAATNVFAKEAGEWRMVHHHAGPMSARPSRRPPTNRMN